MKFHTLITSAVLLLSTPALALASTLQAIPHDIDISTAEVSRAYLDARLGADFMHELLDGDESRFSHDTFQGSGISWSKTRYLELPKKYRVSWRNYNGEKRYRESAHESTMPDPYLDIYDPVDPKHVAVHNVLSGGRVPFERSIPSESFSGFYIRKPNPVRGGEGSGMNVVGMIVKIQYGPDDFPRPIESLNEMKYMNANMLFASWAFNNKELLPD